MSIGFAVSNHVATITLSRVDRGNSLDYRSLVEDLPGAWREAERSGRVRSIVLRAEGDRHFCTGVDTGDPEIARAATGEGAALPMRISSRQCGVTKPVVVAVNGACVGGALVLVADADIAVGSPMASFSNPGVDIGIAANVGAVALCHRATFTAVVRMTLLGSRGRLDATEALRAGILSEVVPAEELDGRATGLANAMAQSSPAFLAEAKRLLWSTLEAPLERSLEDALETADRMRHHPDAAEAFRARIDGRPPDWTT